MLGKTECRRRRNGTEDQMVGWHHLLNGHEFEQPLGDSERQGSLECCSFMGCKEMDMTLRLNNKTHTHTHTHTTHTHGASQVALVVKNPPANAADIRDVGSILGFRRSPGRRAWQATPIFFLDNPIDRGAQWATVHRITNSWI